VLVRQIQAPPSLPIAHRIPHPTLGWQTEPGARVTYATSEFRVPVSYNSMGWRDAERQYPKPAGTYRVVLLGDSFMEAYAVPFERIFAQQLEALISARRGGSVEVINLGVGGYGTLQEYLAFVEHGERFQPDLVLLGFFTNNDLSDNSLTISRAIRREASLRLRSRPFLESSGDWRIIPPDYEGARKVFERSRRNASEFAPVRFVKESALLGLLANARQADARGQEGDLSSDAYQAVYLCDEPPDYVEAWQLTERILTRLASAVRRSGAEFMVFSVPSQIELDPSSGEQFCLSQPPSSLKLPKVLAKHTIPYVDLLPAFRRAHRAGNVLHWKLDGHWNEDGHSLAARQVDLALAQSGR
jgi:hypothetical protein